jgi:hypothetical protein
MTPYTISDTLRDQLAKSRAADSVAARDSMLGNPPPAPQAPNIESPQPTTRAAAIQSRVGRVINTMRGGANSMLGKIGGGLAAVSAIGDSAQDDSTARYAQRFGVSEPTGDGSLGDVAKFAALRAGGFASDLGNNMTGGLAGRFLYRDSPQGAPASQPQTPKAAIVPPSPSTGTRDAAFSSPIREMAESSARGITATPTSAPGVTKLTGGKFNTPMFTDNPARAVAEYDSNLSVIPSSAEADKSFLSKAFQRYISSGDLEGARRTAVSAEDMAALGTAEGNFMRARAQEAQDAPLRRMLQEMIEKAGKEPARFGQAYRGKNGRDVVEDGRQQYAGLAQKLGQALAAQGRGGQEQSPQQAAALVSQNRANGQAAALDTATKQQALQNSQLMAALQKSIVTETDPKKREQAIESLQAITGKYERPQPAAKLVPIDVDTGKKDVMGQPIYKKGVINPETGEVVGGSKQAKPTRQSLKSEADAAIAAGADKKAVEARLNQMYKDMGL